MHWGGVCVCVCVWTRVFRLYACSAFSFASVLYKMGLSVEIIGKYKLGYSFVEEGEY